jgi:hypothetical protein
MDVKKPDLEPVKAHEVHAGLVGGLEKVKDAAIKRKRLCLQMHRAI